MRSKTQHGERETAQVKEFNRSMDEHETSVKVNSYYYPNGKILLTTISVTQRHHIEVVCLEFSKVTQHGKRTEIMLWESCCVQDLS